MSIEENIQLIKKGLPEHVTLVAVSKTKSLEEMEEAYSCGMRDFAESRVQEFLQKYDEFHKDVRWHFIGHLQRNKLKHIVGKVFLLHSLDSIRLLQELEKHYSKVKETIEVLVEINIGNEENKTGISLQELEGLLRETEICNFVKVVGLMTVIPVGDEATNRSYFHAVKKIFDEIKLKEFKNVTMEYLSMGMTGDYVTAVEEGSNMIRIGEGIFGKRIYNNKL